MFFFKKNLNTKKISLPSGPSLPSTVHCVLHYALTKPPSSAKIPAQP